MVTIDGFPLVNEAGRSLWRPGEILTVTIREPFVTVLDSSSGAGAPVRGNRLTFGHAVIADLFPDAATPPC
jgi:hypothetical protein